MAGMAIGGAPQFYRDNYFQRVDNGDGRLSNGEARRVVRRFSRNFTASASRQHLVNYLGSKGYDKVSLQGISDKTAQREKARRGSTSDDPLDFTVKVDPLRAAVIAAQIRYERFMLQQAERKGA